MAGDVSPVAMFFIGGGLFLFQKDFEKVHLRPKRSPTLMQKKSYYDPKESFLKKVGNTFFSLNKGRVPKKRGKRQLDRKRGPSVAGRGSHVSSHHLVSGAKMKKIEVPILPPEVFPFP